MKTRVRRVALALFLPGHAPAAAGFKSPESLIRNVYAHYGSGAVGTSRKACRATARPRQHSSMPPCAAPGPRRAASPTISWCRVPPGSSAPSRSKTIRKQFDKTYVAVAFDNQGRAVTLNFVVVNGPEGWVISDVESPHDSLRMFLTQHRN